MSWSERRGRVGRRDNGRNTGADLGVILQRLGADESLERQVPELYDLFDEPGEHTLSAGVAIAGVGEGMPGVRHDVELSRVEVKMRL